MKKLLTILTGILLGANLSYGLVTVKTNSVALTLADTCDGTFNDFKFQLAGYNYNVFKFSYDVNLTGVDCVFRITKPIEGTIYLDVAASEIIISTTNVTFAISQTNLPPPGNYYGELLSYQTGTTNYYRSLAQGKLPITWSLYLNETNYFSRYQTNATVGYIYEHPNWVAPYWGTTNADIALSNYVVYTDGVLQTNINVLSNHVGATYAKQIDYAATSNDVNTMEALAVLHTGQIGAISNDLDTAENTISLHTSQIGGISNDLDIAEVNISILTTNKVSRSGIYAMEGNLNMGGYSITNIKNDSLVFVSGQFLTSAKIQLYDLYQSQIGAVSNKIDTHVAEDSVTTNTGNWAGTWQTYGPSYFRNWPNMTNTPVNVLGYGLTDVWTKVESDARFGTTGSVAAIEADLTNHKTNVNVHAIAAVSGLTTSLLGKATTGDMAQAQTDIANLKISTGTLNTAVGNLNTATNALQIQATALQGATNTLNIRATNLEGATGSLNTAIGNLQTATNSINANYYPRSNPSNYISSVGTISHTNLLDVNGATDVQHLTAAEKAIATNPVSGSGFPLTNNVNLAGYSMTNGSFVGNGAGLTNLPANVSSLSLTGAVSGAITLSGVGVSQTNNSFNFSANDMGNSYITNATHIDMSGSVSMGRLANGGDTGTAVGDDASGYSLGAAVGHQSRGTNYGTAVGYGAIGNNYGAAVGRSANGSDSGAAIGFSAQGVSYGAGVGGSSDGRNYGVAVGYQANGRDYGVAIGYAANAVSNSVALGWNVVNTENNSTKIKGNLNMAGANTTNIGVMQAASVQITGLSGNGVVPVGTMLMYGTNAAPAGWLLCDGASVATNTYPALYAVIGGTYGSTNAAWFNVPDMRGVFPKGAGTTTRAAGTNALGVAYSGTLGAYSLDHMQGVRYNVAVEAGSYVYDALVAGYAGVGPTHEYGVTNVMDTGGDFETKSPRTDGVNGPPRIGTSTEPQSLGVPFIIKY